ncbi:MAG: hypothetical protein ACOY94_06050 [Bacillota bacterium]
MKRFLFALLVVALVSLTANTALAYITGPHWTTSDSKITGR